MQKSCKLSLVSLKCMSRAVARLRNTDLLLAPLMTIPDLPIHLATPLALPAPTRQGAFPFHFCGFGMLSFGGVWGGGGVIKTMRNRREGVFH